MTVVDLLEKLSLLGSPPGRFLQGINAILHKEPFATLSYGCFWALILMICSPVAGVLLLIFTAIKLFSLLLGWKQAIIDPKELENVEFVVVITGCDSGFGKDLAFTLGREKGFKVFAACLFKESFQQFEGRALFEK